MADSNFCYKRFKHCENNEVKMASAEKRAPKLQKRECQNDTMPDVNVILVLR